MNFDIILKALDATEYVSWRVLCVKTSETAAEKPIKKIKTGERKVIERPS